jgi:hypothetical protein
MIRVSIQYRSRLRFSHMETGHPHSFCIESLILTTQELLQQHSDHFQSSLDCTEHPDTRSSVYCLTRMLGTQHRFAEADVPACIWYPRIVNLGEMAWRNQIQSSAASRPLAACIWRNLPCVLGIHSSNVRPLLISTTPLCLPCLSSSNCGPRASIPSFPRVLPRFTSAGLEFDRSQQQWPSRESPSSVNLAQERQP